MLSDRCRKEINPLLYGETLRQAKRDYGSDHPAADITAFSGYRVDIFAGMEVIAPALNLKRHADSGSHPALTVTAGASPTFT
ncbi:hypothetical protein ACFV28_27235 [Streptomyces sp. NPDC059720]|uniref:hypothetical protein n=1 Tax=Streptomyces sp. NPDC059720 TaxID=3346924 RepID=UPI00367C970E